MDIGYGLRPKIDHPKYKKEELDTASKEAFKIISKDEAIAMSSLGIKEGDRMEMKNTATAGNHWAISFEDFKKGLEPYSLDFVAALAKGNNEELLDEFKKKLVALADLYTEKDRKVVSFWTMGFNQHVRGTWVNEQIYAIHLLLGKQSQPGNGAFSLTGQPSFIFTFYPSLLLNTSIETGIEEVMNSGKNELTRPFHRLYKKGLL